MVTHNSKSNLPLFIVTHSIGPKGNERNKLNLWSRNLLNFHNFYIDFKRFFKVILNDFKRILKRISNDFKKDFKGFERIWKDLKATTI